MELKKIMVHAGKGDGMSKNPVETIKSFTGTGTRSGA